MATLHFKKATDLVNDRFVGKLKRFVMQPAIVPLFNKLLKDTYRRRHNISYDDSKKITEDIKRVEERLEKGRELLLTGDIDGADYKIIKTEGEEKLQKLEANLTDNLEQQKGRVNIDKLLDSATGLLTKLDHVYVSSNVEIERLLVRYSWKKSV